ncbi:MAG TPA: LLM class F420-dependent oxidoreductase [Gaiellaceae bacterium]|nr:LLM class F420-dependent oxidoreductase [Gaiellaceae bacterium]
MRVALMIEGQEGVSWEQWLAIARACEAHGIEALFRSDHYLSQSFPHERVAHDAWTTLAAIAAHTSTLRLGTLVSPVTFRHPSLLANAVSTVDHISGGRVELGMGAGWMDLEHAAFGFPFPRLGERIEMLGEQLEIVHRQWTEEHVSFTGTHYSLDDSPALPKPLQDPHPPLLVGGRAKPKTAALAARWADEYNVIGSTRDDYAEARRSLDEACERTDRDPKTLRMSVMTGFLVGEDEDALLAHARATLERWGSDLDPTELVSRQRAKGTAGTPDELVAGLRSLEEVGVERAMLQHIRHEDLDTIGLLGREVLPRL